MFHKTGQDTGNPLAAAVAQSIKEARQSLTDIQHQIDTGSLNTTVYPNFSANPLSRMNAPAQASPNGNGSLNGGLSTDQFVSQSNAGNWSGFGLNPNTGFVPISGFTAPAMASANGLFGNLSTFNRLPGPGQTTANGSFLSPPMLPPILQLQQTLLGMLSLLYLPFINQNPSVIAPPTAPTAVPTVAGKQNAVTALQTALTVPEAEKAGGLAQTQNTDGFAISQPDVNTMNRSLKTGQFSQTNLASALSDGFSSGSLDSLDDLSVLTGQLVDQGVLDPNTLLNEATLSTMDEAGLNALSQGLANAGIWKADKTVNRSLSQWLQIHLADPNLDNPQTTPTQTAFAQRLTRDTLNAWQGYYDTHEGQYLQRFLTEHAGLKLSQNSTDPTTLIVAPDAQQPFALTAEGVGATV